MHAVKRIFKYTTETAMCTSGIWLLVGLGHGRSYPNTKTLLLIYFFSGFV